VVPLLEIRALTRSFYGVHALRGVDLSVDEGRITGLIGPNGAGKTTLFNCISDWCRRTRARDVRGRAITGWRPIASRAPVWCAHSRSRAAFRVFGAGRTCCSYGTRQPGDASGTRRAASTGRAPARGGTA